MAFEFCDKDKFKKYCEINDRYNSPVRDDDENNTENPNNYAGLDIQTFFYICLRPL